MIKFIADKLEGIKRGYVCPFVYLHGELEKLSSYDIVRLTDDIYSELPINKKTECEVIIHDNIYSANLYLWKNGITKGIIVLSTDKKNNELGELYLKEKPLVI